LLGLPTMKWSVWGGGIYSLPTQIAVVGQKQQLSVDGHTGQSSAHRTSTVHCLVPCRVRRPLGSVAVDRWIRPLPRLSGAHRTVRCYSPRVPDVGLSAQTDRLSHRTCYCSLSSEPPVRWPTAHFMGFFAVYFGLLFLLNLGLLRILYVFF
jgi:hypothetical protein